MTKTAHAVAVLLLLLSFAACSDDSSPAPVTATDASPVLLEPVDGQVYCEGSDIVLIVTDIDHRRDKSFIYMVNRGPLQRVSFNGEDTLRVVLPTQTRQFGWFGTYEIMTGVERHDGTSSLNNSISAQYLPRNSFTFASAFSEGDYQVYADTSGEHATLTTKYRQGTLTYGCLPMPTPLGGRDDAFTLERRYLDGDRRDTLFLRCDEGERVQQYDFPAFLANDLAPDTAGGRLEAEWLQRANPRWDDIALFSSQDICQFPSSHTWPFPDTTPNVLRLTNVGEWSYEFTVAVSGSVGGASAVGEFCDTYISIYVTLTHPDAVILIRYSFLYSDSLNTPMRIYRYIDFEGPPVDTRPLMSYGEGM